MKFAASLRADILGPARTGRERPVIRVRYPVLVSVMGFILRVRDERVGVRIGMKGKEDEFHQQGVQRRHAMQRAKPIDSVKISRLATRKRPVVAPWRPKTQG